jgi:predicted small lipoprotein YifL
MKKVFSVLTMIFVLVSLSACMDDPNMGNKKPKNFGSGAQQDKG